LPWPALARVSSEQSDGGVDSCRQRRGARTIRGWWRGGASPRLGRTISDRRSSNTWEGNTPGNRRHRTGQTVGGGVTAVSSSVCHIRRLAGQQRCPMAGSPVAAKSATPELGCGAPVDGSPSRASIIGKASLLCFARPHPLVRSGQLHPTARRRPRRGGEEPTIRERGGGGRATTQRSKVRELASGRLNQNPTAGRKQVTWPYEVPSFGWDFVL
jgi:hypothetical protein